MATIKQRERNRNNRYIRRYHTNADTSDFRRQFNSADAYSVVWFRDTKSRRYSGGATVGSLMVAGVTYWIDHKSTWDLPADERPAESSAWLELRRDNTAEVAYLARREQDGFCESVTLADSRISR
jgi:hypothetical protein